MTTFHTLLDFNFFDDFFEELNGFFQLFESKRFEK